MELGGVSGRAELMHRCTRRQLQSAVRAGEVVRSGHDLYCLPDVDAGRLVARQLRGALSHLSAAMCHGWKVWSPPAYPMVTVPRSSRRDGADARLFWSTLDPADIAQGVTDPVRTVVDCARALPLAEALAVADSALRSRQVSKAQLLTAADRSPRTGRSRARRVVGHATAQAANPFESALRAIALEVEGFAALAQCPVEAIGHCDVGDPTLRIALEAESHEYHSEREAFRYDCRRYTSMVCAGWLVLRFTWEDVRHRPEQVRRAVEIVTRTRMQDVRPETGRGRARSRELPAGGYNPGRPA